MVSRETSLKRYAELLERENEATNLVSRKLDSAGILELVETFAVTLDVVGIAPTGILLDVGSGGGLPGIPLAISHPGLYVVLNESRRLRLEALDSFIGELDLENAEVLPGRIETVARAGLEPSPDLITAFGVGKAIEVAGVLFELAGPQTRLLLSIPSTPTKQERSEWLLAGAINDKTAVVHERVLAGQRSILEFRPRS